MSPPGCFEAVPSDLSGRRWALFPIWQCRCRSALRGVGPDRSSMSMIHARCTGEEGSDAGDTADSNTRLRPVIYTWDGLPPSAASCAFEKC